MITPSCLELSNRGSVTIEPRVTVVDIVKRGYAYYLRRGKLEWDYETGCLLWLGAQFPDGYGKVRASPKMRPEIALRTLRAQRYFWELYRGRADGYDISHKCHRRLCVWIKHLIPERHSENMFAQYAHYAWGPSDKETCTQMMLEGLDAPTIADKLMAPRLAVSKLMAELGPLIRPTDFKF
jgi:hypothetical protein